MDNEIVKRLAWSGMLTATTALAGLVATRFATFAWRQLFEEDPPE